MSKIRIYEIICKEIGNKMFNKKIKIYETVDGQLLIAENKSDACKILKKPISWGRKYMSQIPITDTNMKEVKKLLQQQSL